jgi:hypothetical protein
MATAVVKPRHRHRPKRPDDRSGQARRASVSDPLAGFSDALSLLAVAHGSLAAKELAGTGDEEVALRHALEALRTVYSDLDPPTSPTRHR